MAPQRETLDGSLFEFPPELKDYSDANERLGEGGFAKVILAEHTPTGQKVAIKIMNKEQLKQMGDLHRAYREIEAMKRLGSHQHICQLFQVTETETDIYLVLEYVSGGELFDYIVSRERLSEKEARSVFRQIISAIQYIHSRGLAHRDLKPENMLLDSNNNIKLIDFGLSSDPDAPLIQPLATCCGSPAYAAPELISGKNYYGAEADIWSLGVVLYGLLNGFLPFDCDEDEPVHVLYQRIKIGAYEEPDWLSDGSCKILGRLLEVKPEKRIKTEQLLQHEWIHEGYGSTIKWESSLQKEKPDFKVIEEMADYYREENDKKMEERVKEYEFDAITAHYYLLHKLRQKTPRPKVSFKTPVREPPKSRLNSQFPTPVNRCQSVSIDDIEITPTKQRSNSVAEPDIGVFAIDEDKEYISPLKDTREKAASHVENLNQIMSMTPASIRPIQHQNRFQFAAGLVTPRFAKRIGKRVQKLMTPKKVSASGSSENPRTIKALYKCSTTSTKSVQEVREEIDRVLSSFRKSDRIYGFECNRFLYKCKGKDEKGAKLIFQLEICSVPDFDHMIGIRHTRLKGDSWSYKKICDSILQQLKI